MAISYGLFIGANNAVSEKLGVNKVERRFSTRARQCLQVLFLGVLLSQPAFAVIEEIVVTAQKREQNIQDVPISISAFSGEQLAEQSITDVFDLQQSAPGLIVQQNQTATTSNFSIRGVGTSGSNFGLESSVGLYVDGVYRARQNALVNELVDMDRVEVLRGPQGTLFGRNSPSGAVLMHTRAPEHEFGGYVDMDVGNLGLFSLNGAVGGTLVEDTLAYRLTGFTTDRDGYVDDVNLGSDEINDRNREGVRAQLLYTPNDVFTARIIADYAEVDEVCCAAVTVRNNYLVFPRNDLTGAFSPTPTFGTDAILGLPPIPIIPIDNDFDMVPDFFIPGFGVSVVDQSRKFDDEVAYSVLPESQSTDRGLSAELNWDLDAGTITAISGWRQFDSDDLFDADFSTFELATRDEHAEQESFSQEIRFSSNFESGTYLVGVYYFQQTLDTESNIVLGADANNFIALSVFQQAQLLNDLALFPQAAAASALGTAIFNFTGFPEGQTARNLMEQDHRAWAVFGQVDWAFRENWELTFGLRYTKEKKELDGQFREFGTSFGAAQLLPDLTIVNPRSDIDETLNDEQITGNIKLSWRPDDNRMYYISYATGYKSGGTNTDRILQAFDTIFDAETSQTYEIGARVDFPDQNVRVNLTFHKTITEDYQTNAFQGAGFNLSNAGEVDAKGAELEVWWNPNPDLDISFAYVHNDAEFDGFDRANCWIAYSWLTGQQDPGRGTPTDQFCDRSGDPIDSNPENTFIIGVTQRFEVSDNIGGYVHADYNYRDEQFKDGNIDPFKEEDGYGVLNLRAGLQVESAGFEISLWGRNVLDEDYLQTYFDVPLQDGKLNAYPTEPRTYGLSLTKSF